MRKVICWVHDIETIKNCFIHVFLDFKTKDLKTFVVHRLMNNWQDYLSFLEESQGIGDWHFGFNSLNFDSQIVEYILKHKRRFRKMTDPDEITAELAAYASEVIHKKNNGIFLDFPEFRQTFKQHDIFRQNHWDNRAKNTSLKWAQYGMDWPNVEEMPHHYTQPVTDWETLKECILYCQNDVMSTYALYNYEDSEGRKQMLEQAGLRRKLTDTYNVNLLSASETKISKEIFLYELVQPMGRSKKEIKEMRTWRDKIIAKDILLPVTFHTPDFQATQLWFEQLVIDTSTGVEGAEKKAASPKHSVWITGTKVDYALGGIHGCTKAGIRKSGNGRRIVSMDVTSYYPMLAILNDWHPAHIPLSVFKPTYQSFFDRRSQYPKGHFLNYLFKIILNATYGLSKEQNCFLYDPEFTFRITLNGQLLLSKFIEMVLLALPGAELIMANTDGCEFMIDDAQLPRYYELAKEWEILTKLKLEFVEYDSMIIRDVNNYISTWTDPKSGKPKTKCKGAFEFEDLPLHKNKSFLVIPKALYAYFINGTRPEEFLANHTHFFDYCAGAKLKGDWHFEEVENKEGEIITHRHQKLLRYYISQKGNKIMKCQGTSRKMQLEAGKWKQTICNQYIEKPFADYQIDFRYYLQAIQQEIRNIEATAPAVVHNTKQAQLSLF